MVVPAGSFGRENGAAAPAAPLLASGVAKSSRDRKPSPIVAVTDTYGDSAHAAALILM